MWCTMGAFQVNLRLFPLLTNSQGFAMGRNKKYLGEFAIEITSQRTCSANGGKVNLWFLSFDCFDNKIAELRGCSR